MTRAKKAEVVGAVQVSKVAESQSLIQMPSMNLQALMEKALEANTSIETLERLMAMSDKMREQWAKQQYIAAHSKFQKECPPIVKSKPVFAKGASPAEKKAYFDKGDTSKVTYCYAPLEDILRIATPVLAANGFSYSFKTEIDAKEMMLKTICFLRHVDGHTEPEDPKDPDSGFSVPIGSEYMSKQQMFGAAGSFSKRYAFLGVTGLQPVGEDDDAAEKDEKKPKGGEDQKFKEPTPKSDKKQTEEKQGDDAGATDAKANCEKYNIRRAEGDDRIHASSLKTLEGTFSRLRVKESRFAETFGFQLNKVDKHCLNEVLDWMKEESARG